MSPETHLEFRRRGAAVAYRFEPCPVTPCTVTPDPLTVGPPRWKRADLDLWLQWLEGTGWAVVDADETVLSLPWNLSAQHQTSLPPLSEWISKKGDRSYVYDLIELPPES